MIRVMDASGITDDLPVYPLMHFVGGDQFGVRLPVIGVDEVNWRIWPALVIVRHGLLRFVFYRVRLHLLADAALYDEISNLSVIRFATHHQAEHCQRP